MIQASGRGHRAPLASAVLLCMGLFRSFASAA